MDYVKSNYINDKGAYNFRAMPNAIDPTVFTDKTGKMWMVYGSWSGGIYILEIDKNTGDVIRPQADTTNRVDPYFGKQILGGGHVSIEAPYIVYSPEADYYYLFVSYGVLTREGGYQVRVFRSKEPNENYVDMNGRYPLRGDRHKNFGLKLSGNYYLPSLKQAYMAPGHNSVFIDSKDGKFYNVFHTRYNNGQENHQVRVHQLAINAEGWPVMLPFKTQGETIDSAVNESTLIGKYFFVNQGTGIDANITEPKIMYLETGGKLRTESAIGTWSISDGKFINFNIDGIQYSGVLSKMRDEAGTSVVTITLAGNNQSLWCVKY